MAMGKKMLLFLLGGSAYVGLELIWRGRSHISMFCAGGGCFMLLGQMQKRCPHWNVFTKGIWGSGIITATELIFGFVFNRNYRVWDYRDEPLNVCGQICLPFSLLWIPVSLAAMFLYRLLDRTIPAK